MTPVLLTMVTYLGVMGVATNVAFCCSMRGYSQKSLGDTNNCE